MGSDQKRAILAVVLSGLILFGWQYFFAPEIPVTSSTTSKTDEVVRPSGASTNTSLAEAPKAEELTVGTFTLNNQKATFIIDNYLSVKDAKFENSEKHLDATFEGKDFYSLMFLTGDVYKKVYFSIEAASESAIRISNAELGINGVVELTEEGKLNYNMSSERPFQYRFSYKVDPTKVSSYKLKHFVYYTDDFSSIEVGDDDKGDSKIKWFGLDFDYHIFTNVFPERTTFVFRTTEEGSFLLNASSSTTNLSFYQVFAKKEYDQLVNFGDNLKLSVDFGMWSIIAVPILRGLQFFYTLIPNYGISIIFLTLLIRMLTFPLQYKSFKSMKKMQVIQPELTKIREKYKSDPQRLQQETMALFKKAGANPLGGCLPLILQMPIFFAFYQVLYSAVELVDAPFYLWIHDLSEKDPYYVLPILMSLAMFFQQKITPATVTDPVQKKILMFMPLVFGLIMKDLPSGLTLYILVSTIFGMAQQLYVYKRVA